jgi:hypothetical protein
MAGYFNIITIIEWITLATSLFLLDKRTGYWRWFIAWLALTVIVEFTGWYMRVHIGIKQNALPFNLLMLVRILFFTYILSRAEMLGEVRKRLWVFASIFLCGALLNLFFYQGFNRYNSFTDSLANIVLAITCCYLLYMILIDERQLDVMKQEYFWLANGLIFYLLGSAMFFNFSYLLMDYYTRTGINLGTYLNSSLNLVLYINLIIAFVCRRKTSR